MRVLVCGGRDLEDMDLAWNWLEDHARDLCAERLGRDASAQITGVIQGGASGADSAARCWASDSRIPCLAFPADWDKHGKAAGPIRNRRMLEEGKPDIVIAFPGGRGTADMVRQANAAGVPVLEVRL